jgi:hypothetical protein
VQHYIWKVNEDIVNIIEKEIKDVFRKKYELVRGLEWFGGTVKDMKKDIDTIIEHIENNAAIEPAGEADSEAMVEHMDSAKLREIIKNNYLNYTSIILDYMKTLFENEANRCVRKTNMQANWSSVHVGGGVWQTQPDEYVYPRLLNDIIHSLNSSITDVGHEALCIDRDAHQLLAYTVELLSGGRYAYHEARELLMKRIRMYKNLIHNAKIIAYDHTKEETRVRKLLKDNASDTGMAV